MYFPFPRNIHEAWSIESAKVRRFREVLNGWLDHVQEGNFDLEGKIRLDLLKANKELCLLKRYRTY